MDDSTAGRSAVAALDGVDPDELFDLLRDRDRRYVLASLAERSRSVHLADLATELAHAESESVDDPAERRRQLSIRLAHCHLPKLADAGLVEFHREPNTVELSDEGDAVTERTDLLPDVGGSTGPGSSE